ncbi:hypothetical protein JAAARDRAFT_194689 [Jaapia argillacea MUCL 33604]|uniref:Nudix hydrolase domain-containing protein n=1 Tax=Jaapia argillacea MUCL 33604 TaxID=933084 RepID=A0A067PZN0_9AGAM|nr:hypothetical protein JAAARDRAFT_194689 [Jaapia argillacea MUCL 33604]
MSPSNPLSRPQPSKKAFTFIDLIDLADNFSLSSVSPNDTLVPFYLAPSRSSPVIGLLRPSIVAKLREEHESTQRHGGPAAWHFSSPFSTPDLFVSFASPTFTPAQRTAIMKNLCERWRDTGFQPNIIGPSKWRDELYPIYRDPFGAAYVKWDGWETRGEENWAFDMERSACALFGVVTYGVHMTVYREAVEGESEGVKIWVPTRAKTKPTWPGYLDNTVAGGITSGMSMFESIVKEAMEEASIEESIVRKYAKSVGGVSYFFMTSQGWLQPEVEYVYDLKIPAGVEFEPKPSDGEVECFELLSLDEVTSRMHAGLFKPNCAIVIIDFMIRHGHVTPDNEPDYMSILTRLHGRFEYDRWGMCSL